MTGMLIQRATMAAESALPRASRLNAKPAGSGRRRVHGFTLVELLVTITVAAVLMLAAAPSLSLWIFNTHVRTAAESLQNGLRLAQAEAVRQGRQVVFGLTNATPGLGAVTVADGLNWTAQTVPNATETTGRYIGGGPMADTVAGVAITGPRAVCFSSLGNLVANAAVNCAAPAATTFDITHPSGDRPLRVQLAIGGRVRMCDPGRASGNPDAC